jgi:hypothetical protein
MLSAMTLGIRIPNTCPYTRLRDISTFLETAIFLTRQYVSGNLEMIHEGMSLSKKVDVAVIGPDPPCQRCNAVRKNAESAAAAVKSEGIETTMTHLDVMSKDVISKYGVLTPPALALNGTVKVMGRIPNVKEIEDLLRKMTK